MTAATGPYPAPLPPGEVHLWSLPDRPADIEDLRADAMDILSPDEKRRLSGMAHRRVADRFLLGRVLLRGALARYLDRAPSSLVFAHNPNGKPYLADPQDGGIGFNLANSRSHIVLAVARAPAVGVDLEPLDRAQAAYRISQSFYSSDEKDYLRTLGKDGPRHALLLWTLKESIVKAQGATVWDGLSRISLAIGGRRLNWTPPDDRETPMWHLAAGSYDEDHVLAVAIGTSHKRETDSLTFRTYRFGAAEDETASFVPEVTT